MDTGSGWRFLSIIFLVPGINFGKLNSSAIRAVNFCVVEAVYPYSTYQVKKSGRFLRKTAAMPKHRYKLETPVVAVQLCDCPVSAAIVSAEILQLDPAAPKVIPMRAMNQLLVQLLSLTSLTMGLPSFMRDGVCPVCEPQFCPKGPEDCALGMAADDDCDCCPVGVCLLSVGQRCLDTTHTPALSLTDLRIYARCGHHMQCRLRSDLDPLRNSKESICTCVDSSPVCGSDNATYSSVCALHAAIHRPGLAHTGPCPHRPNIIVGPVSSTARLGSAVGLGCEIYGVPVPNVIWSFAGLDGTSKVLPGDDVSMVVQSRGGPDSSMVTSWMQIVSARIADSGTYTCVASNSMGEASSAATIVVNDIY